MPLIKKTLGKYMNPVFVESGTYRGQCSLMAQSMGFEVYTIELNVDHYRKCRRKFGSNKIHLYHGNSGELLPEILKGINSPTTVWLDAHPPGELTLDNCPIIQELKAILAESKRLKFKVLIDDMRLFSEPDIEKILDLAKQIGLISYEESQCGKQDIMAIT